MADAHEKACTAYRNYLSMGYGNSNVTWEDLPQDERDAWIKVAEQELPPLPPVPVDPVPIETVNHPTHYGGADDPYEAIKVIEAWKLGFNLGNTVKYISRAEKKGSALEDLKKAAWYLAREIENRSKKP